MPTSLHNVLASRDLTEKILNMTAYSNRHHLMRVSRNTRAASVRYERNFYTRTTKAAVVDMLSEEYSKAQRSSAAWQRFMDALETLKQLLLRDQRAKAVQLVMFMVMLKRGPAAVGTPRQFKLYAESFPKPLLYAVLRAVQQP